MTTVAQAASRAHPAVPAILGAAAWVTSSTICVVALAHVVREASARVMDRAVTPWLNVATAQSLFLLGVMSLAFAASRCTRNWPVGRETAVRWFSDGAVFTAAAIALLLLLAMPSGGGAALRAPQLGVDIAAVVLPSLTEELSFRGVLATTVASSLTATVTSHRVRAVLTILICSAAFSVAHENAPSSVLLLVRLAPRFGAGVLLGALARRSGSLLPPMLAHATYNALTRAC